jgi:epoxyqueuosine reductase
MLEELKRLAESNGDRLASVSMERIRMLQTDLAKFRRENDARLSDYQKWIFDHIYSFDEIPPHMQSVIIVAVPRPAYAKVTWHLKGKEYRAFSGAAAKAGKTFGYITATVRANRFEINKEPHLPLRRIAVQSGLARYGRNNIAYVEGMGSALTLLAFSTDAPCEENFWQEPVVSPTCESCKICMTLCPTGAIVGDKFHIDSHKCLTKLNQSADDFPDWVPPTAHHSTYYCMMCQARCPMNKGQKVIEVAFNEKETARILGGGPYDDVSDELKAKVTLLNLGKPDTIPRNLRALFDVMDGGHVPKL